MKLFLIPHTVPKQADEGRGAPMVARRPVLRSIFSPHSGLDALETGRRCDP